MRYALNGRTVLITGGARGIGLATARLAASRGARVALLDMDGDEAAARARDIGDAAAGFPADVRDSAALEAAVAAVLDRFGNIDVAIANAGIAPPPRSVMTVEREAFERVIDINWHGVWNTVRATLPHVVAQRGQLVLVSSIYAAMNGVLAAPYAASKAAVEQLGRALRVELEAHGTNVAVAYFGFVRTGLVDEAFASRPSELLRQALPAWATNPIPVERAAKAMVGGIERRSVRITAPRWVPAFLAARGILGSLDGRLAGDERIREAVEIAEHEAAAELPR